MLTTWSGNAHLKARFAEGCRSPVGGRSTGLAQPILLERRIFGACATEALHIYPLASSRIVA